LFTTEATLSRHIIGLEKELGQLLFSRTTRKVELTEFGAGFLTYARRLVHTMEECEGYLISGEKDRVEKLVIGAFLGPIPNYKGFKCSLSRFRAENPGCRVGVLQADDNLLREKLRRRECDVILVREPEGWTNDDFGRIKVATDPLCVVLPNNHRLAGKQRISIAELANENLILPHEHTQAHKRIIKQFHSIGLEPKISSVLQAREVITDLVNTGMGVAVMRKTYVLHTADSSVLEIELYPPMNEDINILYPLFSRLPNATRQILKCFEESFVSK
jgi:DNA-binding transcriptional LysR family regulator